MPGGVGVSHPVLGSWNLKSITLLLTWTVGGSSNRGSSFLTAAVAVDPPVDRGSVCC